MLTVRQIASKLLNVIKRASITNLFSDNNNGQIVQVQYMDKTAISELVNTYGVSSLPPKGSQFLIMNLGANEDTKIGIAYDPEGRFKNLKEGEVVVGNNVTKSNIKFNSDGSVTLASSGELNMSGTNVTITGGTIDLVGDVNLGGPGGPAVARVGDTTDGSNILTGSGDHTAT